MELRLARIAVGHPIPDDVVAGGLVIGHGHDLIAILFCDLDLGKRVVAAGQGHDALQGARTIPDHLERVDLVFALEGTRRWGLYLALLVHRQRAIRRQLAAVDRVIDNVIRVKCHALTITAAVAVFRAAVR